MKILQNAVKVIKTGEILNSRDRHDYVVSKCGLYMVDGGLEYLRANIENEKGCINLYLYEESPIEDKVDKLLWGTYGKNGDEDFKWIFLKDAEKSHLENILKLSISNIYREVINYILK